MRANREIPGGRLIPHGRAAQFVTAIAALILSGGVARGQQASGAAEQPTSQSASQPATAAASELNCPVCGQSASLDVRTRFRGKRVYFCSDKCLEQFKGEPYAFGEAVLRQWEQNRPWRAQVRCPVTGETVRRDIFLERRADDVYFANEAARDAFEEHPERYADALAHCYVLQSTCATCDNDIRADVSLKVGERTIFHCCPGCRGAFDTDRIGFLKSVDDEIKRNRETQCALERDVNATP